MNDEPTRGRVPLLDKTARKQLSDLAGMAVAGVLLIVAGVLLLAECGVS